MKDLQTEVATRRSEEVPKPERRRLIAAVSALVGAALGKALTGRDALAAQGDPVLTDLPNTVAGTTTIDRSREFGVAESALVIDTGGSAALEARSNAGAGILGIAGPPVATATWSFPARLAPSGGVFVSENGTGAVGVRSPDDVGSDALVEAASAPAGMVGIGPQATAGVLGISTVGSGTIALSRMAASIPNGAGVLGMRGAGSICCAATYTLSAGVAGFSEGESGVRGLASGPTGVGVSAAHADGGTALRVEGTAEFATVGFGTIPPKVTTFDVDDPRTTAASHVMVTFTTETKKMFVSWVELMPGIGFRMNLSKKPRYATDFTYLIVDAAP